MSSLGHRKSSVIALLFTLLLGVGCFYGLTNTGIMASKYRYADFSDKIQGLVIEAISGMTGSAPGFVTRKDSVCQPSSGERGCMAWAQAMRTKHGDAYMKQLAACVDDTQTLHVKNQVGGAHSSAVSIKLWCDGHHWRVTLAHTPKQLEPNKLSNVWTLQGLKRLK